MSAARQKGTEWESRLLPLLRALFYPDLDVDLEDHPLSRAGTTLGCNDRGDFLGVPWPHEAKKTDVPHFLQWAKVLEKKSPGRWTILWSGDQRRKDGPFVMLPLDFYLQLVAATDPQYDHEAEEWVA